MALYVAGQRIRASELNRLPQMYYVTADVPWSNDTFANVTGLSFAADASTRYFAECFISFEAPEAADIWFGWTYPTGTTAWFGADGVESGAASSVGSVNNQSLTIVGKHAFSGENDAGIDTYIRMGASFLVSTTAGTIQLQAAQLVNTGTDSIVRAGSCMRVSKLT